MSKITSIDQLGVEHTFKAFPKRIVSIVPSQTEFLHFLGLEEETIGITKFCIHPDQWYRSKPRIGGTKTLSIEKIKMLKPDLIIGNKEENQKEQIEALANHFPVWMSDILTIEDALEMMLRIGDLTNHTKKAKRLVDGLRYSFENYQASLDIKPKKRAAYFIWKDPYMVAAGDTFINEMLKKAGYTNIFAAFKRYPQITLEDLAVNRPEVILLSSEPYPFKEKHFEPFKETCPEAKVIVVDGELFSWYGSRMLHSIDYFKALHTQLW